MARALELARNGLYTTEPNPRVGCVIAHGERIVGGGGGIGSPANRTPRSTPLPPQAPMRGARRCT